MYIKELNYKSST